MTLGILGILYGAILAFAQSDLKRLVAYTSISHMGFVLMGVFSWNAMAMQGVVVQMVCHGLSAGAQFMLVGSLYERIHTRDIAKMGGLGSMLPRFGVAGMFFAMASLGLPGLGNFIAEFLILAGLWQANQMATVLASLGLVAATIYSLWFMRGAFFGPCTRTGTLMDLGLRELLIVWAFVIGLAWLGLYPQPLMDAVAPSLSNLTAVPVVETALVR
jgi:NADH-quinone oxidoreductase subunit M